MEDELVKIWQSSPNQERVKFEKSRLMLDVQNSIDRFDRMVRLRDLWETSSAALVVPIFGFIAYKFPYTLSQIGCVLIMLWAVYVVIRLRGARKHKPGAYTETYLDYLYKTREHLKSQRNLLDTILYWYLIPCHIGATLVLLGFYNALGNLALLIKGEIFGFMLGVAIYITNKQAVKKTLLPRLDKIEKLIAILEK